MICTRMLGLRLVCLVALLSTTAIASTTVSGTSTQQAGTTTSHGDGETEIDTTLPHCVDVAPRHCAENLDVGRDQDDCRQECNVLECDYDAFACNTTDVCPYACSLALEQNVCLPRCMDSVCSHDLVSALDAVCDAQQIPIDPNHECASGCRLSWLGDHWCDANCNVAKCAFDLDDCDTGPGAGVPTVRPTSPPTINPSWNFSFTSTYYATASGYRDEHLYANRECAPGCWTHIDINNNYCDNKCNVAACAFDGTDCGGENGYCDNGWDCPNTWINDGACDEACRYKSECVNDGQDCYCDPKACPPSYNGDGSCDSSCNTAKCNYDGGDCSDVYYPYYPHYDDDDYDAVGIIGILGILFCVFLICLIICSVGCTIYCYVRERKERIRREAAQHVELEARYMPNAAAAVAAPAPLPVEQMTQCAQCQLVQQKGEICSQCEARLCHRCNKCEKLSDGPEDFVCGQCGHFFVSQLPHISYTPVVAASASSSKGKRMRSSAAGGGGHGSQTSAARTRKRRRLTNSSSVQSLAPSGTSSLAASPFGQVEASVLRPTECEICLEEFEEDDKIVYLPCFHTFHADCAEGWLKNDNCCPNCRVPLTLDSISQF